MGISQVHTEGGDYKAAAAEAAGALYAYGHSKVLFKPTKAAEVQFRPTAEEAMSYFVGGKYEEDGGFAINGGKGWSDCVYENHDIDLNGDVAMAMGNYFFTCATSGAKAKVEYTFGYKVCEDGKIRIFLHHSSVPYHAVAAPSVTEADVLAVQAAWAAAIKNISQVHTEGGDYKAAAAEAAGALYAYGHSKVLFKPTKAAEAQFRPKDEEDGGFAINGGKGWSECVYENHDIETKGDVAMAMGNYFFTCATTNEVSKVEYTFGYERCKDGKVRI